MEIQVIVTVDGVGYTGVFHDLMTQEEVFDQIKYAFKQMGLFSNENKDMKVEMRKPKAENLKTLASIKVI